MPLLEDESSIVLVLSETLRAVAHGAISTRGAALMLDGCRLAHSMLMERLKAANAERARRRQEAIEDRRQEREAECRKQEAGSQEPGAGSPEEEAGSRKEEAGARRKKREAGRKKLEVERKTQEFGGRIRNLEPGARNPVF